MKSDLQLKRWHRKLNRLWFDGQLPDAIVFWETVNGAYADFRVVHGQHIIRINPALAGWPQLAKFSLLHEQVHQKLYPYQKHGRKFNAEMLRLAEMGALDDLW
jgi:hypothetical protein